MEQENKNLPIGKKHKNKVVIECVYVYVRAYRKYCSSCFSCSRRSRA